MCTGMNKTCTKTKIITNDALFYTLFTEIFKKKYVVHCHLRNILNQISDIPRRKDRKDAKAPAPARPLNSQSFISVSS